MQLRKLIIIKMSKYLKRIFGKEDDDHIPEMKLQKNEPKAYYNKELKCWLIEGQEEQIKKELEEKKKLPQKFRREGNNNPQPGNARRGPNVVSRYASVLTEDQQEVQQNVVQDSEPTNTVRPNVVVPERVEPSVPVIMEEGNRDEIQEEEKVMMPEETVRLISELATSEPISEEKFGNTLFVSLYINS
jgi:hypothetical protein